MLSLEQFRICARRGFLGLHAPLPRLTDVYFAPWEEILDDLAHLLVTWKLRSRISKLPVLDAIRLRSEQERERAFLVLSLLSHAYVWGAKGEPVLDTLPAALSLPWTAVGKQLGLRPTSCHAALVYFNWKLLDQHGPMDLSNLATLHTVSGGIDESWFYLITIAIEACGAKILPAIVDAVNAVHSGAINSTADSAALLSSFSTIQTGIQQMTDTLMRMPEHCDPYIFYHRVRIYFSGWSNMKDLPGGLLYEGDTGEIEAMFEAEGLEPSATACDPLHPQRKRYPGGSAAQSTLIHTLDVFLGVQHFPTRDQKADTSSSGHVNFLKEMRFHILRRHRAWLHALEKAVVPLHERLHRESASSSELVQAFNGCVEAMKTFRNKHIQIVTRYIVIQARRSPEQTGSSSSEPGYHGMGPDAAKVVLHIPPPPPPISPASLDGTTNTVSPTTSDGSAATTESRGTGGTDILPFLKQSRDETDAAKV